MHVVMQMFILDILKQNNYCSLHMHLILIILTSAATILYNNLYISKNILHVWKSFHQHSYSNLLTTTVKEPLLIP